MEKPTWIVEIEKMKAQRDDARAHNNILMDQVTGAEMQAAWCKEQRDALLAALKAAPDLYNPYENVVLVDYVDWWTGQRQAAIAAVSGEQEAE